MKLNDLQNTLEQRIEYPVNPTTVKARIGDTQIDAPDRWDSVTVGELLAHVEDDTYRSSDELFDVIVSYLPDPYIGRKFYDDRGSNPHDIVPGERAHVDDHSF